MMVMMMMMIMMMMKVMIDTMTIIQGDNHDSSESPAGYKSSQLYLESRKMLWVVAVVIKYYIVSFQLTHRCCICLLLTTINLSKCYKSSIDHDTVEVDIDADDAVEVDIDDAIEIDIDADDTVEVDIDDAIEIDIDADDTVEVDIDHE